MKKFSTIQKWWTALGLLGFSCLIFFNIPRTIDVRRNSLYPESKQLKDFKAPALHAAIFVADLHADTLLWNRDLLQESTFGHVDVPRLLKGNIALQGFSIVTKSPRGLNIDKNSGDTDNITLLAIAQRWPPATWNSLTERALYQARALHSFAARSHGVLTIIKSRKDLFEYLARRQKNPHLTAGFISIEGAHALEGDLSKLDSLYEAGVRMIAPTHFFDTEMAGSAHGISKAGLSPLGQQWLEAMEKRSMIVDLAHASPQTIDDVLARATRPPVVSHTGVKAVCNNNRNLSDEQLKKLAQKGALVGIGFWSEATCGEKVSEIIKSILHATEVMGAEHVALGSDFDGFVSTPIDSSQIGAITQGLLEAGLSEEKIRLIMGENVSNFMLRNLP